MQIGRAHSWKKVIAQLFLLALPTIALAFYMLWNVNQFYALLENRFVEQGLFFATGIITSIIFYGYRFRFITTATLLFSYYLALINCLAIWLLESLMHFLFL